MLNELKKEKKSNLMYSEIKKNKRNESQMCLNFKKSWLVRQGHWIFLVNLSLIIK